MAQRSTPPKFSSSPLKNGGWERILSSWVSVTFQGRTVKLREAKGFLGIIVRKRIPRQGCLKMRPYGTGWWEFWRCGIGPGLKRSGMNTMNKWKRMMRKMWNRKRCRDSAFCHLEFCKPFKVPPPIRMDGKLVYPKQMPRSAGSGSYIYIYVCIYRERNKFPHTTNPQYIFIYIQYTHILAINI